MICHECGKRIEGTAVARDYYGYTVSLHEKCSKRIRPDITARATTSRDGRTYVDDAVYASTDGMVRLVHKRPADE